MEKALKTVWEEAYAPGEVRSDLSVGWYNSGRALTLIRVSDGAGAMGATSGLMGDMICVSMASRRRSGLTAAGSKSKNRLEDLINDYIIGRTSGRRAVGLRSYVYPDRALRRAQRKQMRRRGQQRHANYGGSCVDRETTDTGGF